jgi:hypothetical protein
MSVETVRFIGPIFVVAASLVSILMVVIGAAGDIDRADRERDGRS